MSLFRVKTLNFFDPPYPKEVSFREEVKHNNEMWPWPWELMNFQMTMTLVTFGFEIDCDLGHCFVHLCINLKMIIFIRFCYQDYVKFVITY